MDYILVQGEHGLVRDCHSKAILNADNKALERYRRQRDRLATKQDTETLRQELERLQKLVAELTNR